MTVAGPRPTLGGFNDKISSWKGIGVQTLCSKTFFRGHKHTLRNAGEHADCTDLFDFEDNARSIL